LREVHGDGCERKEKKEVEILIGNLIAGRIFKFDLFV